MSEKLESAKSRAKYCIAHQFGVGLWQVNYHDKTYEVNLLNWTCGWFKFQLCGLPCEHACAAIFKAKEKPENYVSDFLKLEAYKKAYAHMIFPVPHESEWVDVGGPRYPSTSLSPATRKTKKNRRKGAEENLPATGRARKTQIRCGNCKKFGHNISGCDVPLRSYLALMVKNHVVSNLPTILCTVLPLIIVLLWPNIDWILCFCISAITYPGKPGKSKWSSKPKSPCSILPKSPCSSKPKRYCSSKPEREAKEGSCCTCSNICTTMSSKGQAKDGRCSRILGIYIYK